MMSANVKKIASHNSFSGTVNDYSHISEICDCEMTFSLYLPAQSKTESLPAIFWLSGLTCDHENFITKAGAQRYADIQNVILIMPDTSPRNVTIKEAETNYDIGYGAGFYVNATQMLWKKNFQMYSYIIDELMPLVKQSFPILANKISIMGHSMGGHGAMMIGLRNPDSFCSISAFAPICAPSQSPWGIKAFNTYLGADKTSWLKYDSCHLIKENSQHIPLLIDQGSDDEFLAAQLMPNLLLEQCQLSGYPVTFNMREGFDHSYYFIATFIGEHIAFHKRHLTS